MEKLVPFQKLSKKKKKELVAKQRGTWGALSPVTRKADPPKAYKRKKARNWCDDTQNRAFLVFFF